MNLLGNSGVHTLDAVAETLLCKNGQLADV